MKAGISFCRDLDLNFFFHHVSFSYNMISLFVYNKVFPFNLYLWNKNRLYGKEKGFIRVFLWVIQYYDSKVYNNCTTLIVMRTQSGPITVLEQLNFNYSAISVKSRRTWHTFMQWRTRSRIAGLPSHF
jgi:hypothetical protein